ncbi:MAG TPA: polysaccharide deacetylase family protein, partial [Caldilineae bacterium]|nr:polysaccharide deacetylase family protein [Caldilineae bacterium]
PTATPTPSPTPGPTPDGQLRTARVPILMYHYISTPPPGADAYRRKLSLAPDIFAQHLDYLQQEGYATIHLEDLISYLARGVPELPEKPIILTFDDGYLDNYENAFPALRERGMVGTFFIITDFADLAASDPNYAMYATWDDLRAMDAAGMELGSHSRNHPDLKGKDIDFLVWQALGSSQTLEANLGKKPRVLAYPFGSYDAQVIDVFRSAGFWGAVTTEPGVAHRSDAVFELARLRIFDDTGVAGLAALLDYWAAH